MWFPRLFHDHGCRFSGISQSRPFYFFSVDTIQIKFPNYSLHFSFSPKTGVCASERQPSAPKRVANRAYYRPLLSRPYFRRLQCLQPGKASSLLWHRREQETSRTIRCDQQFIPTNRLSHALFRWPCSCFLSYPHFRLFSHPNIFILPLFNPSDHRYWILWLKFA